MHYLIPTFPNEFRTFEGQVMLFFPPFRIAYNIVWIPLGLSSRSFRI
jgi:hypothetical protein